MKTGRRRTKKLTRRKHPAAARSAANLQKRLDQRTHELAEAQKHLAEALEQQTATSEVLQVISSSPGELTPVFQAMLENATRLCEAETASLVLREGGDLRFVARYNAPAALLEQMEREPLFRPGPASGLGRSIRLKQVLQVPNLANDPAVSKGGGNASLAELRGRYGEKAYYDPELARVRFVEAGYRSQLSVPLIKNNEAIGAFNMLRQKTGLFTEKQIELVTNFAAQAVIAIENTRFLNELRQRTDDLSKALEQQTATSEVLRVISSSPGELQPVFEAILANAKRLCEAQFGILYLSDGDMLRFAADVGTPPKFAEFQRQRGVFRPRPGTRLEHVMLTKEISHTADLTATAVPDMSALLGGARSTVYVPMLKDEEIIGVICIYRQEVRPFTDKQIALVQNFAAQAVIAIENTRLLNELRQRTADLSESLEQQTATSEILKVISSSPGELQSVFQTILTNATRICDAKFGAVYLYDGNLFHCSGEVGSSPDYAEFQRKRGAFRPQPGTHMDRIIRTKQVNVSADATAEAVVGPVATIGGARSVVSVPMLKDDELIGVVGVYRQEVRPFNDKQIELVKNFAAQAVIAIENTRLLNELRQSLDQQTATADVLRVISSSPGELEPVFQAMLENAVRIC